MTLYDQYVKYFKYLCSQHPDILHTDTHGSKSFSIADIEEAFGEFRGAATEKGISFRLINYINKVDDNYTDNQVTSREGGFIIVKHNSERSGNQDTRIQAVTDTERIMFEFIERMIHDSQSGHSLFYYEMDTASNIDCTQVDIKGDGSYIGWICLFTFGSYVPNCIDRDDAPSWTDNAITPDPIP